MSTRTQSARFAPNEGAVAEYHILVTVTDPSLAFESQLDAVMEACSAASAGKTLHFRRFFLSDAASQYLRLVSALEQFPTVPTSIIGQAPLDGTLIAAWLYATSPMESPDGTPVHNGYTHYWDAAMTSPEGDSYRQMSDIFAQYGQCQERKGLSVARDTIRTWIFVRDIDNNYAGVVRGRREYFDRIGLTVDTHYIASTGIEGNAPDSRNLVAMDAYCIGGLQEGQLGYLYALDHLSRTSDYGVTFERGATVTYGDRKQLYISGTASIDAQGKILFEGDVRKQTGRMLENVRALLAEAGAGMQDIAMAIVYLREDADYPAVKSILEQECPSLHAVYVHAPVCRPAWLVEMECIAMTPAGNPAFPLF